MSHPPITLPCVNRSPPRRWPGLTTKGRKVKRRTAAAVTALIAALTAPLIGTVTADAAGKYPLTDRATFRSVAPECRTPLEDRDQTALRALQRRIDVLVTGDINRATEVRFVSWCVEHGAYMPLTAPFIASVGHRTGEPGTTTTTTESRAAGRVSFPCNQDWTGQGSFKVREGAALERIQRLVGAASVDGRWGPQTRAAVEEHCGIEVGDVEVVPPTTTTTISAENQRFCDTTPNLRFCIVGGWGEGTNILGDRYVAFGLEIENIGSGTVDYSVYQQDMFLDGVSLEISTEYDRSGVKLRPGGKTEVRLAFETGGIAVRDGATAELILREGSGWCFLDCEPETAANIRLRLVK